MPDEFYLRDGEVLKPYERCLWCDERRDGLHTKKRICDKCKGRVRWHDEKDRQDLSYPSDWVEVE